MRKPLTAVLLALLLACSFLPAALAQEAPASLDITVPEEVWMSAAAWHDGQMVFSGSGIWAWRPGEDSLRPVISPLDEGWDSDALSFNVLVLADGETLYCLDYTKGMLFPMTLQEKGFTLGEGVSLDLSALASTSRFGDEEHSYVEAPQQALIHQGQLYLITQTHGPMQMSWSAMKFDIKTGGAPQKLSLDVSVRQLAPYKDGSLLALTLAEKQETAPEFSLAVLSPDTDSLTPLGAAGIPYEYEGGGLAYDPAGDYIYLSGKDTIYRRDAQGETLPCAYITPTNMGSGFSGMLSLLPSGRLLLARPQQLALRDGDPAGLPTGRLTIYGSYIDDTHKKTIQAMNGIPVNFLDRQYFATAQQLGQALVSGEDDIDIFFLRSDAIDLTSLMKKGYCLDLTDSAVLMAHTDSLYPAMKETGMLEGQLLMVPVEAEGQMMGYYSKPMEASGLTPPENFFQLCDFLQQWNDNLTEQASEFIPLQADNFSKTLLNLALSLFNDHYAARGEPMQFNDPLLKDMLARALSVDTRNISPKVDWSNPQEASAAVNSIYNRPNVITSHFSLDLRSLHHTLNRKGRGTTMGFEDGSTYELGHEYALPLSYKEGEPAVTPLRLTLMAINPRSKNLDAAKKYAETLVQNLPDTTLAMINPSMNAELVNPYYQRDLKTWQEALQRMAKSVETAEGAEKTELQRQYDESLESFETYKDDLRVRVSAQAIQYYRDRVENSYIKTWGGMDTLFNDEAIAKLLNRLLQGQMPLEQFLKEAEGKMRLMQLERE